MVVVTDAAEAINKRTSTHLNIFADCAIKWGRATGSLLFTKIKLDGFRDDGNLTCIISLEGCSGIGCFVTDAGLLYKVFESAVGDFTVLYTCEFDEMGAAAIF